MSTEEVRVDKDSSYSVSDWQTADPKDIVTHIRDHYHERHRMQMPELVRLAKKVEKAHSQHPQVPKGLAAYLHSMQQDLFIHMQKEEQILFPMLERGLGYMADGPILCMDHDHSGHVKAIGELMLMTHNAIVPEGADDNWKKLYSLLASFCIDLLEHIHCEDVFYKRFLDEQNMTCETV